MKPLLFFTLLLLTQNLFAQNDSSTTKADSLSEKTMKEVVVGATKRPIEVYADKTVLNLDVQPSAVGETALDVLRRSPNVTVDGAENVQMNGKAGVTILIDGKNTQLSAQDVAQLLKSMEAGNIKQVELISNPSAKYDAAGNAGIINIKLKKSLTNGFNGSLSGSYVQSTHARQNITANLNWRQGKTAFFLNGGFRNGLQHTIANNDRSSANAIYTQRSIEKDDFDNYSIRTGADVFLTKKSTLGFLWMRNRHRTSMDNGSTSVIKKNGGADTNIISRSIAPFTNGRNSFNLNYAFTNTGFEYALDADYTVFTSTLTNLLSNRTMNDAGTGIANMATQNNQQVTINLYSIKGDFTKALSSSLKLESGFKIMMTRTANSLQVSNNEGLQWLPDTGKTNFFRYREDITAVYAAIKSNGKKLSWQLGMRGEHTKVNGQSASLKNSSVKQPDTSYLNLFPTAFFQFRLSEKNSLGLTATRRIDRPSYQDQNPFIYALDALNSEQGNPYLSPQVTNAIEISYTRNYATSFKISYAKTTDYFERLTYQTGNYTVMIPQNSGTREMVNFSLSSPVTVNKKWSAYVSVSPYYHYYRVVLNGFGKTEKQNGGSWGFNGYVGNTIQLGKGFTGSISSWFNFQNRATIYVSKPIGSLDLGIQKNVWKEKATVKLSLIDILNTQRWQQTATTNDLQLTTYRKWESRNITLGFSWRFGNTKLQKARVREAVSEVDSKRIK